MVTTPPRLDGACVLVAIAHSETDVHRTLRSASSALVEAGAEVRVATGFEQMIAACSSWRADAFVIDVRRSTLDSGFAERLRRRVQTPPLIATSLEAFDAQKQSAARQGFCAYLSTPLEDDALLWVVADAIGWVKHCPSSVMLAAS
jgi:CheY-like chemotaxis protein